jgi:hypothetical protein
MTLPLIISSDNLATIRTKLVYISTCMTLHHSAQWQTWNTADPAHRHEDISSMSALLDGLPGTCEVISNAMRPAGYRRSSSKKIAQRSVFRLPSTLVRWITHPSRRVHCAGEAHHHSNHQLYMTPARTSVPPQLSDQSSQTSPLPIAWLEYSKQHLWQYICTCEGSQERRWCMLIWRILLFFSFCLNQFNVLINIWLLPVVQTDKYIRYIQG